MKPSNEHKVVLHPASISTKMTFLSAHLPFPEQPKHKQHASSLPPPRSHLLVTDTPLSPAHFTVHHLIASAIARRQKVIWVDLRQEGKSSLEAVLRKMVSHVR